MSAYFLLLVLLVIQSEFISINSGYNTFYLEKSSTDQTNQFQNLIYQMNKYDKIIIKKGNHYISGTVHIDKPNLIIIGEKGSIIRKSGRHSAIDIDKNSNQTRIENIEIDGGDLEEPCMRVFSDHNYILGRAGIRV